jgi:type II secretory pathway pseudopilin PulG
VLMPGSLLPLLGASYHRACESTCDRYGAACCAETQDAVAGITALAAGEKRWKTLSVEEYVAQAQASGGFWMSFHELVSDYPWLVKRVARVIGFREGTSLGLPARHPFAYLFALFVPRTMGGGAGGLMSLLALVAMVGIVAAIAIPSLLSARTSANESAAIGEITTVVSAQAEYARQHERFASIACLAAQPGCASAPANPPLLAAALVSSGPRNGYRYQLKLDEGSARQFAYTAVPVNVGEAGRRSFCADSTGKIYSSTGAEGLTSERATCNPALSPLGGP